MEVQITFDGKVASFQFHREQVIVDAARFTIEPRTRADWLKITALDAEFDYFFVSGGRIRYIGGIITVGAITFSAESVDNFGREMAELGKKIAATVAPPPYMESKQVWFSGAPSCCGCGSKMAYNFTGPFSDKWYSCEVCKIKYCAYDGKYEYME